MTTTHINGTPPAFEPPVPGVTAQARPALRKTGTYREAEQIVDALSDAGFPVASLSIVGTDLRYVEQIRSRLTTAGAALGSAAQGAMLGLLLTVLFGLFFSLDAGGYVGLLLYGVLSGALFGALLGALSQAATGGRRDFSSTSAMVPAAFQVLVDADQEDHARQLLLRSGR